MCNGYNCIWNWWDYKRWWYIYLFIGGRIVINIVIFVLGLGSNFENIVKYI